MSWEQDSSAGFVRPEAAPSTDDVLTWLTTCPSKDDVIHAIQSLKLIEVDARTASRLLINHVMSAIGEPPVEPDPLRDPHAFDIDPGYDVDPWE